MLLIRRSVMLSKIVSLYKLRINSEIDPHFVLHNFVLMLENL